MRQRPQILAGQCDGTATPNVVGVDHPGVTARKSATGQYVLAFPWRVNSVVASSGSSRQVMACQPFGGQTSWLVLAFDSITGTANDVAFTFVATVATGQS